MDKESSEFETSEIVGLILQYVNRSLCLLVLHILQEKSPNMTEEQTHKRMHEILCKTNGGVVTEVIQELNITDEEEKKRFREIIDMRNLICHAYPMGEEYWRFTKEGFDIFTKEEFHARVYDALVGAMALNLFVKDLCEDKKET